jgi:predicted thioesterase
MKPTLQISNSAQLRFTVTPQMQPQFGEKAIHPVCSTWDMAHQFEIVARQTLEPHLEDGEEGIGSFLSIDHCAPAVVGKTVLVEAKVTELDNTSVVCSITATVGSLVCATGKQIQRVLPRTSISTLIEKAASH